MSKMSIVNRKMLASGILALFVAIGYTCRAADAPAWPEALMTLRNGINTVNKNREKAARELSLHELNFGPWYYHELRIHDQPVNEPMHDYDAGLEKRFSTDCQIGLREKYIHIISSEGKRERVFRKAAVKEGAIWSSRDRHRNHSHYYYRTIDADSERAMFLYLGFCEGGKVFLNGKEVFAEFIEEPRECRANQAKVELPLRKGTNHLLLKFTGWKMHVNKHASYISFNPVPVFPLSESTAMLEKKFPLPSDWMMQDLDRYAGPVEGNELNRDFVSKNLAAFLEQDRDTGFEQKLIEHALAGLDKGSEFQDRLNSLISKNTPVTDTGWLELYVKVCEKRRLQRLADMNKRFPRLLFIKRGMLRPSFYGYTEGLSCANFERNFVPGSSLCLLEWEGDKPIVTDLLSDEDGTFRDLDVSWDGKRILFAWKKSLNEDDYHLYEMSWPDRIVRQLTFGKGVADFEGCYLPNGDILFSSSRCISTTDCWTTEISNLYTCDKDGKYMRRLGFDQVVTVNPSVLENGSVIYTRWDYNDRGQVFPQPLFQMNPDGTGQTEYYGNNSWFPTVINHARGIPGTGKVLAVLHGHHTWQAGELAVIDRSKGTQETSGVKLIAPVREHRRGTRGVSYKRHEDGWIEPLSDPKYIAIDRYGQDGNLHRHPYPLTESTLVTAMTPYWNARDEAHHKLHLYWMDYDANRELLVGDHSVSCAHPMPLASRKRPHVRPSTVDYRETHGTYFMQDIYEGPGLKGIERGTVKKLRVVALEFRALKIGANNSGGRGGGAMSSTPISTGNGAWDIKRILGEAKVYEDGSAMFKVPANTPLYFQAIDEDGSMVQTMRSWSTLMPGETYGCVGCHEDKRDTPPARKTTMAMKSGTQVLTPFYGPARGFSFTKEVQPILNKHCIKCHNGEKKNDEGKLLTDLTEKRVEDKISKRAWTRSYLSLTHSVREVPARGDSDNRTLNWVSAQSVPSMLPPRFRGSHQSGIVRKLRKGHGKTKLNREELDKIAAWIDLGVPFCGDYLESNTWNDYELRKYISMQRKREKLADEVRRNTEAFIAEQTGKPFRIAVKKPRYTEYQGTSGIDQ